MAPKWPETLVHRINDMIAEHPDKTSVKADPGRSWTYQQLDTEINKTASALLQANVKPRSGCRCFSTCFSSVNLLPPWHLVRRCHLCSTGFHRSASEAARDTGRVQAFCTSRKRDNSCSDQQSGSSTVRHCPQRFQSFEQNLDPSSCGSQEQRSSCNNVHKWKLGSAKGCCPVSWRLVQPCGGLDSHTWLRVRDRSTAKLGSF